MSRNFMGRLTEASSRGKTEEIDISSKKTLPKVNVKKEKKLSPTTSEVSKNCDNGRQVAKIVTCVSDISPQSGESKLVDERSDSPTTHSMTEAELQMKFDSELAEYKAKENLVSQCSEYIFDLFDANCLDDYKTMEAFETMALDAFTDFDSTEITFEQHALHNEFLELFESLISGFLRENSCSVEEFHVMCHSYLSRKDTEADSKEKAQEVVDVIFAYTDLNLWTSAMRERAKLRHKYRQQQAAKAHKKIQLPHTAMEEAMDTHYQKTPAKAHRFDSK